MRVLYARKSSRRTIAERRFWSRRPLSYLRRRDKKRRPLTDSMSLLTYCSSVYSLIYVSRAVPDVNDYANLSRMHAARVCSPPHTAS